VEEAERRGEKGDRSRTEYHKDPVLRKVWELMEDARGYLSDALMLKEILEGGESERVSEEEAHAILFGDED